MFSVRLHLKCDGTRTETRFRLWAKRTSPFKSAGTSVQPTTRSRGVRISGSNAGYTMFRGSVKGTGYPLHSPVSPSFPLPCVNVCHNISTGVYAGGTVHELAYILWVYGLFNGFRRKSEYSERIKFTVFHPQSVTIVREH